MKYYLGIDSGSVSLKAVIINEKAEIIKSSYIKNYNLMVTLQDTLKKIRMDEKMAGVGVTGTGADFISKMIDGDIIEPETVAHGEAVLKLHPEARTVLDIGGQDSKIMPIREDGLLDVPNFNKSCGAGTGGFIEFIASELDVKIEDVGDLALQSKHDFPFAGKCSVFARTSVVDRKNKGIDKEDILMGVCKALAHNYFAIVAKGIKLIPPYVFQGATAMNKALVKSMEMALNHEVIVPKYPHLMGAYGIALITMEDFKGESTFKGFNFADVNLKADTYIAGGCTHNCEITLFYENDKYFGFIKTPKNDCEKCVKQQ